MIDGRDLLEPAYTIQPVQQPIEQPIEQPAVSCKQTFNQLSSRLLNRIDNRLYRVNGVSGAVRTGLRAVGRIGYLQTRATLHDATCLSKVDV